MATYSSIKYSNTPTNSVTTADIADTYASAAMAATVRVFVL